MKRILLASVAALGLAGTASAADLAVKAPVVYAPLFTWTGCYIGANGGWIGGKDEYVTRPAGQLAELPPAPLPPAAIAAATKTYDGDGSDGIGGAQLGCQVQLGSWVIGAEGDYSWSGLEETFINAYPAAGFLPARVEYLHKEMDWLMTARGRLGFAWDRVLIYGTAGLAYAAYDSVFDSRTLAGVGLFAGGYRENRIGWTAGGGIEWAFSNNWTAKAEALYVDFGSFDYKAVLAAGAPYPSLPGDRFDTSVDAKEIVVRVGINYLFHTGGAPVVAKY